MKGRGSYFRQGIEVPASKLYINAVAVTSSAAELNAAAASTASIAKLIAQNAVTLLDGSTGKKACLTNGVSAITGGTGIADLTLAAPSVGDRATIRIDTYTSGDIVVTCGTGVTFNGTNDIATFNALGETLVLAYKATNTWQVVQNIDGVVLSGT